MQKKHELAPAQIHHWKKLFLERCSDVFESSSAKEEKDNSAQIKDLHAKIGELNMINDWLKKS